MESAPVVEDHRFLTVPDSERFDIGQNVNHAPLSTMMRSRSRHQ